MDYATRLVLIPEELYHSLTSQRSGGPLGSHMNTTLSKMDKILHTPALNDEQKYALYNTEFKRLQNLKNETYERTPATKVDVANIPSVSEELSSAFINALKHYPSISSSSHYSSKNNDEEEDVEEEKTLSPSPRLKRENVSIVEKTQNLEKKVDQITAFLMQNKEKYGIDNLGRVLNDQNLPIRDSNVRLITKRMLGANDVTVSPAGSRTLKSRLKIMPMTQKLFETAKEQIQSGKGIGIKSKPTVVFKPTLWPVPKKY